MTDQPIEANDAAQSDSRKTLTIKRSPEALELRERLQKVLATSGLGARRGMEERILKGEITLNGAVPELGAQVKVGDRIGVDDRTFVVKMQEGDFGRILLYNKPDGEVTTRHDPEGRKTVFETLPRIRGARWIAVGRLDINTQGLLVFTTNGELAQKLMHPENEFEREYLCRLHGEVTEEIVQKLTSGVELADGPAAVTLIESMDSAGGSNEWWRVVIKEGRNREVRRLWEAVGLQVSRLKRASFGPFVLPKGLHRGELAELGPEDVQKICVEMGISQNPSQLIAEDELAGRLRRNRVGAEGAEGKKRFVAATKSKAEAFWTGERGYGGAGSRPVRAGGGEFDLGGSERPRDARPKRGKPAFGRGKPGSRAPFVGPMGPSSFEAQSRDPNARGARDPNAIRGPRGPRDPNAPRGPRDPNAPRGPRNDRRGQRRAPSAVAPTVGPDGMPVEGIDAQPRFAPRPQHSRGPRPDGSRNRDRGANPNRPPRDPNAPRRDPGAPMGERPPRDPNAPRRDPNAPMGERGPRRDRPRREPGQERVGEIGNRVGETLGRKRGGFMRGALGTAEAYDVRFAHADSEDYGNRIGGPGPAPRTDQPRSGDRRNQPKRAFSGPMDNAVPRYDHGRPEVDGNSVAAPRGPRPERAPRPPRDPASTVPGVPVERGPNDGAPRNRKRRRRGGGPRPNAATPNAGGESGSSGSSNSGSGNAPSGSAE